MRCGDLDRQDENGGPCRAKRDLSKHRFDPLSAEVVDDAGRTGKRRQDAGSAVGEPSVQVMRVAGSACICFPNEDSDGSRLGDIWGRKKVADTCLNAQKVVNTFSYRRILPEIIRTLGHAELDQLQEPAGDLSL